MSNSITPSAERSQQRWRHHTRTPATGSRLKSSTPACHGDTMGLHRSVKCVGNVSVGQNQWDDWVSLRELWETGCFMLGCCAKSCAWRTSQVCCRALLRVCACWQLHRHTVHVPRETFADQTITSGDRCGHAGTEGVRFEQYVDKLGPLGSCSSVTSISNTSRRSCSWYICDLSQYIAWMIKGGERAMRLHRNLGTLPTQTIRHTGSESLQVHRTRMWHERT